MFIKVCRGMFFGIHIKKIAVFFRLWLIYCFSVKSKIDFFLQKILFCEKKYRLARNFQLDFSNKQFNRSNICVT